MFRPYYPFGSMQRTKLMAKMSNWSYKRQSKTRKAQRMAEENYRYIATEIGDLLKMSTTINGINRTASSLFRFQQESFSNDHITSSRAQEIYNWIMSLARQKMTSEERNRLLTNFCHSLANENELGEVAKILNTGGISKTNILSADVDDFQNRKFHQQIHIHCKQLYIDNHYFHAVFEACKVYNKMVRTKSQETKDGHSLMMAVWSPDGVLKITPCQSETDHNVQNGIKFLSAGIMQAVRNPTAHEPAIEWPISKDDCLDILSFMSFLFKKLDEAIYYKK